LSMVSELDSHLALRSSLTKKQIERLSLQISAEKRHGSTIKSQPKHLIVGVSEGAYYRVVDQAKKNVDEALYTLLLCSRMGVIRTEDLTRLLRLVIRAPEEPSENTEEVVSLVDALVRKIVMI